MEDTLLPVSVGAMDQRPLLRKSCVNKSHNCTVYLGAFAEMMFIIDKDVHFNEEGDLLENPTANVSVLMATSTRRLLSVLIAEQGNPVEREMLFKKVWDDNGLRSSHSNLNQYISMLRKQLTLVGLPDDTIITIPKVGFMFNPNIEIRTEQALQALDTDRKNSAFSPLFSGSLYWFVYTSCILVLCLAVFFAYFHGREAAPVKLRTIAGYPHGCIVNALPGTTDISSDGTAPVIAGGCEKNTEYFIYEHIGSVDDRLTVSCKNGASGYYIHCNNRLDE